MRSRVPTRFRSVRCTLTGSNEARLDGARAIATAGSGPSSGVRYAPDLGWRDVALAAHPDIQTIGAVARAGATIAVAGSAVFNQHGSVAENLGALERAAGDSS
jgi:hypothetical protein